MRCLQISSEMFTLNIIGCSSFGGVKEIEIKEKVPKKHLQDTTHSNAESLFVIIYGKLC